MLTEPDLLTQGLLELAEDTSVGVKCCEKIVERVARLTGVRYAFVGLLRSDARETVDTLATFAGGEFIPNISYALMGTPCANVMGRSMCVYPSNVCAAFPEDLLLQEMEVSSYLGAPIFNTEGKGVGILVLLDDKPLNDTPERRTLVQIHAARAGAEIDRMQYEQRLREMSRTLEREVLIRTAELEEANKQLGTFAYSISHDLRAPLRHIMGYCELLAGLDSVVNDTEAQRMTGIVLKAGARMGEMMEALLAFAHNNRQPLNCSWVDMPGMLREVVTHLSSGESDSLEVNVNVEGTVWGDPTLLRSVFQNLVGNAIKYSAKQARPRVNVMHRSDGFFDEITVEDNGVGFDMKYADKLFGVFQRLHSSQDFPGHGIGLANAAAITRRLGGTITASSHPGDGARFTLKLIRPSH
jgi:signal transduction histidine kinase